MPEKVLSQDEINALFSAMSDGKVDVEIEDEEDLGEVALYDLASRKVRIEEKFEVLDEIHDKFSAFLRSMLSTTLRSSIDSDFISSEIVEFQDFLKSFARPTSFNIYSMEPLPGSGILVVVEDLVFSMIDCIFGGTGKPISRQGDFTQIEQRVLRRVATDILKQLEKAWEVVHSVRLLLKKSESNPEFVHIYPPNEMVIVASFSITGNHFSGNIYICLPYSTIEPIKEKLTYRALRATETDDTPNELLKETIYDANIDVSVELGRCKQTIGDILNMQEGDVIRLDTGPNDLVKVCIENIPKYRGIPGIVGGTRAVRISEVI